MSPNYDTLFLKNTIIEDFITYMIENEITDYEELGTPIDEFITNHYWSELNKYFYDKDNTNDTALLMYIKYEDEDIFNSVVEYMNDTDNICYVRERIYQSASWCRLKSVEEEILARLNLYKEEWFKIKK
mgnify:FL=1